MPNDHIAYKYETSYKGPFVITWCWTNGTVTIKYGPIQIRHNIRWIKLYKSDTNVEDINTKNMCDNVNILSPVIYFCTILKLGQNLYDWATHKDPEVN